MRAPTEAAGMTVSNRQMALILLFFAICAGAGYAVYWWHETSLDRIAMFHVSFKGESLNRVSAALADKRPAQAREILQRQPLFEKIGILKVLSRDEAVAVRMFAVRCMRPLRDVPQIRAELARLAAEDPEESVTRLASRALQGRR